MGAGASAHDGFDVNAIPAAALSEDIKNYYGQADALSTTLANRDYDFFAKECKKLLKSHSDIIKRFTSRNKSQLKRITKLHPDVPDEVAKVSDSYGPFLKCCMSSADNTNAVMIVAACSGLGCDDNTLLRVLCTSEVSEFAGIGAEVSSIRRDVNCLATFIGGKVSKDALLNRFFTTVLKLKQRVPRAHDGGDPAADAAALLAILKRKQESDVDTLFEMLVMPNRDYTGAIVKSFQEQFNEDLTVKIMTRFGGSNFGMALVLWMLPLTVSVAKMLNTYCLTRSPSVEFVYGIISRYNKPTLAAINEAFTKDLNLGDTSLRSITKLFIKGKLRDAINGWIENTSPDNEAEGKLLEYLRVRGVHNDMSNLNDVLSDAAMAMAIRGLLEDQVKALSAHLKVKFTPIPLTSPGGTQQAPSDAFAAAMTGNSPAASSATAAEEAYDEAPPSPVKNCKLSRGASAYVNVLPENEDVSAHEQISAYLLMLFQQYDADGSGELESEEFWRMIKSMQLEAFGFTEEEISVMQELCDWDSDGGIAYEEVINELAFNILSASETQNIDVKALVEQRMAELNAQYAGGGLDNINGATVVGDEKMPPGLEGYMQATFEAYDIDKSGALDVEELMQMVRAMNLGTTDKDIEDIRHQWDSDGDSKITWEEALPKLVQLIHSMASDYRDHWIGLVDKETNYLYWYNVRDQSSQWMSDEDQEAYKAHEIAAPSNLAPAKSHNATRANLKKQPSMFRK